MASKNDKKPESSSKAARAKKTTAAKKPSPRPRRKTAKVTDKATAKPAASHEESAKTEADVAPAKSKEPVSRRERCMNKIRVISRFLAVKTPIAEILLLTTVCFSRYMKNSDFSYPSEVILNIALLSVLITIIFYVLRCALRNWRATHFAALPLAYALYAYTYSFTFLHKFGDWLIPRSASAFTHAVLQIILMMIVFGAFGYGVDLLLRRVKHFQKLPLFKFMLFVVAFVFAAQMVKVGARMWTIRHDLAYKQPAFSLKQDKAASSKPNVYYLVFDRYANADTLKNDYDFDNSKLLTSLTDQGFVVRRGAYSNYPFTMQSITSTLSMGYHTELGSQFKDDSTNFQTAFPYRTIFDDPPVAEAFKQQGYNYNQISSWWDFTRNIPAADDEPTRSFKLHILGKDYWLTDLQRDILYKSALSPLLNKGLTIGGTEIAKYSLNRSQQQNFDAEFAALKTLAKDSKNAAQPQFTFAHILSPHDPYIFDANCQKPTYDRNRTDVDIDETIKYTNQVTCLNSHIEDVIASIRSQDPSAVVIIQADEGPYPKQFRGKLAPDNYYDPINLPLQQMRQKFGVLAAYYMPGVDDETVEDSITGSVNVFRFVLSHYLGYDTPALPDCQFTAGNKYTLYSYQQVTGKLKGTTDPAACSQYL